MAYRLEQGERVTESLRRCAREQLDKAIEQLTVGIDQDPVAAVHDTRKALKKERSLLRLARGSLRRDQRRRENAAFREAGRRLSGARDADVIIQALDELSDRNAGQLPKNTFAEIRERLDSQRQIARQQLMRPADAEAVVDHLKAAQLRIDEWRLKREGWAAVGDGLLRGYKQGRKASKRARSTPTIENLHDWRKRVKDLWYHLRLLRPVSPRAIGGHADDAHHLADLLGDDHDLALLRHELIRMGSEMAAQSEAVVGLIDHRRDQLQTEAFFVAERLYAERPKAFRRRVRRYWKAWRRESAAVASHRPAELAEAARHPALA